MSPESPIQDAPEKGTDTQQVEAKETADIPVAPEREPETSPAESMPPQAEPSVQEAPVSPAEPKPSPSSNKTPQPGCAMRCFEGLSSVGPALLVILWAIQSLPTLMGRELCGLNALVTGVTGTGASYALPDPILFPVYHWFLSGLALIPGLETLLARYSALPGITPTAGLEHFLGYPTALLPLATCLSTLFFILLTWALARAVGCDRKTALASGLVLLTSLSFMGLPRAFGGDVLFAAVLTLSSLCLYKGWVKDFSPLWLMSGFALTALATLAGGLIGLLLPLLTSLFFLLWRGTFRRAGGRDGALAFGLMLVLLLCWGTLMAFSDGGAESLKALLSDNYAAPLQEAWNLAGRESGTIVGDLALLWLPWTALVVFLPWEEAGQCLKAVVTNRTRRPGQGWLWCSAIVALLVPALLGADMTFLILPMLAPLAILTAQGLLSLSAGSSRFFFLLVSIALFALGALFAAATILPHFSAETPALLKALQPEPLPLIPALVKCLGLILFALLLGKATRRSFACGALLVMCILTVLYTAPLAYFSPVPVSAAICPPAMQPMPAQADPVPASSETPAVSPNSATPTEPKAQQEPSAEPQLTAPAPAEPSAPQALPAPDVVPAPEKTPEAPEAPAQ